MWKYPESFKAALWKLKQNRSPNPTHKLIWSPQCLLIWVSSLRWQSLVDVEFPWQETFLILWLTQTSFASAFSQSPPRPDFPSLPHIPFSLQLDFGPNPGFWPNGSLGGRYLSVKNLAPAWVLRKPWWSQAAGPLSIGNSGQDPRLESLGRGHWWPGIY